MEIPNRISEVCTLVDRYVRLLFLVNLFRNNSSKSAEDYNNFMFDIDFSNLGLSQETVLKLGDSPNLKLLMRYQTEMEILAEHFTLQIFGEMSVLSIEEKIAVKEYIDNSIADLIKKIDICEAEYKKLVEQIKSSTIEENSLVDTRALGREAKAKLRKYNEYKNICQNYSNVSSYLRGMIKNYIDSNSNAPTVPNK